MKSCPPPTGSFLPNSHQPFFFDLLRLLGENQYHKSKIDPQLPTLVDALAQLCENEDGWRAWCDELREWVKWYRVPAYWLTYIFQFATQLRGSIYHFVACDLHADAQTNFADDLALLSLETAYGGYTRNKAVLGEAYDEVGIILQRKLRFYYDYYYQWSRPFEYIECNPCADHLYNHLSQTWLMEGVKDQIDHFDIRDAKMLLNIIHQSKEDEFKFYGILAGRFLGLHYAASGENELSIKYFEEALADARRLRLDTEIGHLRRLLGSSLRAAGRGSEAQHQFEQAYAYEKLEPFFLYTSYWQALSARELGDTILRFAGQSAKLIPDRPQDTAVIIDNVEKLRPALHAYHDGRMFLNAHMSLQCPFPVGRAAKQQIFRSFSQNAIQVACLLQSTKDMLAEVEWSGPREATEMVTEIAAAREINPDTLEDFRKNRAVYYQTLNTLPSRFEDYLSNLDTYHADRRAYVKQSFVLDSKLISTQWCDKIVEKVLAIRLPNTVFLMFHIGVDTSTVVLMDMSSGLAAPFVGGFGEKHLRDIHEKYLNAVKDSTTRRLALDKLIAEYSEMLDPVLEPILKFLPGKHLKIFPRLHMNTVPLHALYLKGKYLIEHCATISYGQTLGLFLENHAIENKSQDTALRVVIGNDVPWYELLLPKIRSAYNDDLTEEHEVTWSQLIQSIKAKPANDILFACHGQYSSDDLESSSLELSHYSEGKVLFSRVFAGMDLRECRSVIMGSCESGLTRTEIGAEYIGLSSAMLSSGVRYVIGALWTIPQVATAVLIGRYLALVKNPSTNVCTALCQAKREIMSMKREDLANWVRDIMASEPELDNVLQEINEMEEQPFSHPYYWAGLQVVGDV